MYVCVPYNILAYVQVYLYCICTCTRSFELFFKTSKHFKTSKRCFLKHRNIRHSVTTTIETDWKKF